MSGAAVTAPAEIPTGAEPRDVSQSPAVETPKWAKYERPSIRASLIETARERGGVGVKAVSNEFQYEDRADLALRVTAYQPYVDAGTEFEIDDGSTVATYRVDSVCCGVAVCERIGVRSR